MSSSVDLNCRKWFERLERIDGLFLRAMKCVSVNKPEEIVPSFFLSRTHSGFLTSFQLASGGQLPESCAIMRSCIESAVYAFHIWRRPEAASIWLGRMERKKDARDEFGFARSAKELKEANPGLSEVVQKLYERTIDLGAHPNVYAVMANLTVEEDDEFYRYNMRHLNGGSVDHEVTMKSLAEVGVATLLVHDAIWHDRFSMAGLSADILAERTTPWVDSVP